MENRQKRIALITLHTPTLENTRGASALPFHLIKYRPKEIRVNIYSYNINKIDDETINKLSLELGCDIQLIKPNIGFRLIRTKFFSILRAFLMFPVFHYLKLPSTIIEKINVESDYVWIYGEEIGRFSKIFKDKHCVTTTPDCEAMYYKRVLGMPSKLKTYSKILRYGRAYWQYLNVVKDLPDANVIYHLVGKADADFFRNIKPNARAVFIPHPHYEGKTGRTISFTLPKIRLLIPGRYDFYCYEAVDEVISALINHLELSKYYDITFQGRDWDEPVQKLEKAGFSIAYKGFVPDYKEELCKHDIQLSPISVGTGTKGKVLDAFVNGLLVIAPKRAIENILVKDGAEFLFYSTSNDLIKILFEIPQNIIKYEQIAQYGRKAVLEKHNTRMISKEFFDLFKYNIVLRK